LYVNVAYNRQSSSFPLNQVAAIQAVPYKTILLVVSRAVGFRRIHSVSSIVYIWEGNAIGSKFSNHGTERKYLPSYK